MVLLLYFLCLFRLFDYLRVATILYLCLGNIEGQIEISITLFCSKTAPISQFTSASGCPSAEGQVEVVTHLKMACCLTSHRSSVSNKLSSSVSFPISCSPGTGYIPVGGYFRCPIATIGHRARSQPSDVSEASIDLLTPDERLVGLCNSLTTTCL